MILRRKVNCKDGGIFAHCFDNSEVVKVIREELLRSAQQMCVFTYSQTFDVNSVNCFQLHDKTVQCVLPRCNKYSKAPQNIDYTGTLKKVYHHCAWPFIMRPLNVGVASLFSSSG